MLAMANLAASSAVLVRLVWSAEGAACSRSHCFRLALLVGRSPPDEDAEVESEAFLAKPAATSTKAAAAAFSFMITSASACCPDTILVCVMVM